MGYNVHLFKDRIPQQLICTICNEVSFPPVKTPCDHVFCEKCLQKWSKHQCPLDRQPFSNVEKSTFLKKMIEDFEVKCEHWREGCLWEGPLSNLKDHLKKNCEYGNFALQVLD